MMLNELDRPLDGLLNLSQLWDLHCLNQVRDDLLLHVGAGRRQRRELVDQELDRGALPCSSNIAAINAYACARLLTIRGSFGRLAATCSKIATA